MTASRNDRLRVVLADPDPLVRHVVREELRKAGFVVVADTGDGRDALDLVRFYRPDLAVMEARFPSVESALAIRAIAHDAPQTRVVVLSADSDEELGLDVLRAGAVGYLSKHDGVAALPRILAKVADGEAAVPRGLSMRVLESMRRVPERGWRPLHSQLTTREWQVVELLSAGAGTHDIADQLVLSPATVYGHVKNIMRKLHVRSRPEAVAAAQRLRPAEMEVTV
jgi:two-component system nitrate/nitrite response regulator NarL